MRLYERTSLALGLGMALGLGAAALSSSALAQEQTAPPEQAKRGVQLTTEQADQGATLFTPLRSKVTFLVGPGGETLHTWESEYQPGNSVYLLEDGSILRTAKDEGDAPFSGGGEGGRIQRIGWDGELLWDYPMANEALRQHHDIEPLASGNVLAIVWEGRAQREVLLAGRDESHVAKKGLWPDAVVELEPDGLNGAKVVWEWHAFDHLVQDRNERLANFGKPGDQPWRIDVNFDVEERPKTDEELAKEADTDEHLRGLGYTGGDDDDEEDGREPRSDWMHTNAIDYHEGFDLIAISVRQSSEVWIIDHSTTTEEAKTGEGGARGRGGDLLYRFGRSESHDGGAHQQLFHQHDARFIAGAKGLRMTVFNNGGDRPGGDRSSVDEYRLPFSPEEGFKSTEGGQPAAAVLAWSWNGGESTLYNGHISGAQRLASGNTLMCLGEEGRTLELTPDGEVVWDWLQEVPAEESQGDRRGGDGPKGGGPGGQGGPGGGPDGGGKGPRSKFAIFRVTRYPVDFPGLARLEEKENR